jgi:S-layer protein
LSGASVTSVNTSATTGTAKITIDASKATYTGGAGVDVVVNSAATSTKAIALGAGDDSYSMTAVAPNPTGKIDGGAGTDNISMTAALAATASADAKFAGIVSNFESVTLTGATNQTIDLSVLGSFSNVTTSAGNGLTLNNMPTGGSLTLTGTGTAYTVAGDLAAQLTKTDILNLKLTDGSNAAVNFATTGITNSHHETVAITTVDTGDVNGDFLDLVTLLGNTSKTITVAGNAGLELKAVSTALTSVDASGITVGGFTWVSGVSAVATVKGSATGANTITTSASTKGIVYTGGSDVDNITIANSLDNDLTLGEGKNVVTAGDGSNKVTGGSSNDTVTLGAGANNVNLGNGANSFTATSGKNVYVGGSGVDTVSVGSGGNSLTLGTGADVVTISAAGVDVNSYTDIKDAHAGVVLSFLDLGTETFTKAKVDRPENTTGFQDFANTVIASSLGDHTAAGAFGWFQYKGDTYLVENRHDTDVLGKSFVNGTDMIVKLTGLIDLSGAFNAATGTFTLG